MNIIDFKYLRRLTTINDISLVKLEQLSQPVVICNYIVEGVTSLMPLTELKNYTLFKKMFLGLRNCKVLTLYGRITALYKIVNTA